jgi:hypothetical protein
MLSVHRAKTAALVMIVDLAVMTAEATDVTTSDAMTAEAIAETTEEEAATVVTIISGATDAITDQDRIATMNNSMEFPCSKNNDKNRSATERFFFVSQSLFLLLTIVIQSEFQNSNRRFSRVNTKILCAFW